MLNWFKSKFRAGDRVMVIRKIVYRDGLEAIDSFAGRLVSRFEYAGYTRWVIAPDEGQLDVIFEADIRGEAGSNVVSFEMERKKRGQA